MDKLDLVKCGIKVAAQCTSQRSTAGVLKTICINFIPNLIDFVDETRALKARRSAEIQDAGPDFDPFNDVVDSSVDQNKQEV